MTIFFKEKMASRAKAIVRKSSQERPIWGSTSKYRKYTKNDHRNT